jgi:hypothetical protein
VARDYDNQTVRERIRRNVGRAPSYTPPAPGPPVPGRYGLLFAGGDLIGGATPGGAPGAPIPDLSLPSLPQGRIIGVAMSTATGTREVAVTDALPAPCIIRALTVTGNVSIAEVASFRILLASDADVTAVADPTGQDLIEFAGDVIGAEDVGVHSHLTAGNLVVEPWRKVLVGGQRIKLKFHNIAGATRILAVYVDLDDLVSA